MLANSNLINIHKVADTLFVTWCCRCIHVQLSHLRSLTQYRDRFEYRIAQLTATQLDALNNLLSGIHAHERRIGDSHSIRPCCSKGAGRQPAASTLDRVPIIITAE